MRRLTTITVLLAVLGAVVLAQGAAAAGPAFGVADDAGKYADDGGSNFFLILNDIGLTENRMSVLWDPTDGNQGFTIRERGFLDRAIPVAAIRGIDVVLDVYPLRAKVFDVDTQNRIVLFSEYLQLLARTYPTVTKFIVGNEPNQPRFNQPQFVKGRASSYQPTAGALYERVLASAYDALKAVNPKIDVIGLGLSPRGNDDPRARSNISRSPVRFIHDLAVEYQRSDRTRPLMDDLGFHPYPSSNADPLSRGYGWPNAGIPDLGRIKQAIWDGFHGTGQPVFDEGSGTGPSLGLELDEYGRQVTIISSVARLYTGRENVRTVTEARQAVMYTAIARRVECDPSVRGFFFFHLVDESNLDRFQSGLLRFDWTKRPSYGAVKQVLADTNGRCAGAPQTWRHARSVIGADVTFDDEALTVQAAEDVIATTGVLPASLSSAQILEALSLQAPSASSTKLVRAYRPAEIRPELGALRPGTYVEAVLLRAAMNPDRTFVAVSDPVTIG